MEWIETPESSTISRIGYDPDAQVVTVEFSKSGSYQYFDVPLNVFEEMKRAGSKGQFLAQQIKGAYRFAKM